MIKQVSNLIYSSTFLFHRIPKRPPPPPPLYQQFKRTMTSISNNNNNNYPVTLKDVETAHERVKPYVHETPILTSQALNKMANKNNNINDSNISLFFKCENFQKTGSFKIRGATNAVFSLTDEEASNGICTHSSGNHAQAVAQAALWRDIDATIVMPDNAPPVKKTAVIGYKANVVTCKQSERATRCDEISKAENKYFIHPSNNPLVIAGQGTIALEFLNQVSELDAIIVPLGGGGLISGISAAAKGANPNIKIFGAEPLGANDAYRSKEANKILNHLPTVQTIADGLRTTLGSNTFPFVRDFVDEIFLVKEQDIVDAMKLVYERMKIVIEPSAGTGVAVAISNEFWKRNGIEKTNPKIGVVICGGNIDFKSFFTLSSFQ